MVLQRTRQLWKRLSKAIRAVNQIGISFVHIVTWCASKAKLTNILRKGFKLETWWRQVVSAALMERQLKRSNHQPRVVRMQVYNAICWSWLRRSRGSKVLASYVFKHHVHVITTARIISLTRLPCVFLRILFIFPSLHPPPCPPNPSSNVQNAV